MSEPAIKSFRLGDTAVAIFTFASAGDTLVMHTHDHATAHFSVLKRGRFRIHGPTIGDNEYDAEAVNVVDFAAGHPHEFIALTDDAVVVQVTKNKAATV